MKFLAILFSVFLLIPSVKQQPTAETVTITVTVQGIRNTNGSIGVALFDDNSDFPDDEPFKADGISLRSTGDVEIVFEDVPAGDYAVAVIHDENENEDIDMNQYGMPIEGFAFSNDAMGEMGPPDFDQAAFTAEEDTDITVTLIYMGGY